PVRPEPHFKSDFSCLLWAFITSSHGDSACRLGLGRATSSPARTPRRASHHGRETPDEALARHRARGRVSDRRRRPYANPRAAASLRDTLLASSTNPDSLDHLDGDVYCDSTSGAVIDDSTGGAMVDDAGFVPLNADMARCENTVGTNLARLVLRVIRCHMTLA